MKRFRSAVVIVQGNEVALIERVNERGTYYLFPSGGIEADETIEAAAVREAREELGVDVRQGELLSIVHFSENDQYYFSASIVGRLFGTGTGEELHSSAESDSGSYKPVWLPCAELIQRKVYPIHLAKLIADDLLGSVTKPVVVKEICL